MVWLWSDHRAWMEASNIKLSHTVSCGTRKYLALKVVYGEKFYTSVGIYDVGVIMDEYFWIDTIYLICKFWILIIKVIKIIYHINGNIR